MADPVEILANEIEKLRDTNTEGFRQLWDANHELNRIVSNFLAQHPFECDTKHTELMEAMKVYVKSKLPEDVEERTESPTVKGASKVLDKVKENLVLLIVLALLGLFGGWFNYRLSDNAQRVEKLHTMLLSDQKTLTNKSMPDKR